MLVHWMIVFGKSAFAGFLVERRQVVSGLLHHFYYTVERHAVMAVGEGGISVGIQGTGGCVGVALDAGNLHQPAYRVARHAQVMLQSHFGSVFNLCGASAEELAGSRRSHRARYAHFCLASRFGARNGGVVLHDVSYQSCGGKCTEDARVAELTGLLQRRALRRMRHR